MASFKSGDTVRLIFEGYCDSSPPAPGDDDDDIGVVWTSPRDIFKEKCAASKALEVAEESLIHIKEGTLCTVEGGRWDLSIVEVRLVEYPNLGPFKVSSCYLRQLSALEQLATADE